MKKFLYILLFILIISGFAALSLLAWSTYNIALFAQYYDILFLINLIVAFFLFIWILVLVINLINNIRKNVFGSRLTSRFAFSFIIISVMPGLFIYILSIHFMSRSLESWFNVRVNNALNAGLNLGKTALDYLLDDLLARGKVMADRLSLVEKNNLILSLDALRESNRIKESMIFTNNGRIIAFSTENHMILDLLPSMPSNDIMNQLRFISSYSAVEEKDDELFLRVIVAINHDDIDNIVGSNVNIEHKWLQLIQPVSVQILYNARQVQQGFRDYQDLYLSRVGLSRLYFLTLTISIILTIFSAILFALLISRRLVKPLLTLAEGTQAVGLGDYRQLPEIKSKDELGVLTKSFNDMIKQLEEARIMVEVNKQQLERSNIYLERILSNLSSGVLVVDKSFCITMVNQGARNILKIDIDQNIIGVYLGDIKGFDNFCYIIRHAFNSHDAVGSEHQFWQQQCEITLSHANQVITILARGTRFLMDSNIGNYLVVFDDITSVISSNRSVVWEEVAQRLAHEIKNPLTPIQLSAERMLMCFSQKLNTIDVKILERSVNTIVNQVTSLKKMVDDFREYAKISSKVMKIVDINSLINEVLSLYGWNPDEINNNIDSNFSIDLDLDENIPYLKGNDVQLRQVLHNLLSNARDAIIEANKPGKLKISTKLIKLYNDKNMEIKNVRFILEDNGLGFDKQIIQRVFEPYITTKAHGTGLGLAIVRKIIEEHDGNIDLINCKDGGARVSILFTKIYDKIEL
ncbi:Sensor histidine kinase ResE [Candidatus Kinetoplastibacterium sorsogonicusi]|uniref:histidine kinase n=1 Tax=Candidatus Kinetoplastidibacterium kentomonadis TaxID=1576550 RepID=A0A3Q8EUJ2_9PROT|nr:ATP-binding protein [Candidatus Kinetoplastibacterium sorsogonicusi]AWD32715.1 Sensor histidine kinase ResE [Candidatus Kinetoplastibacterium sorsogonicusi]